MMRSYRVLHAKVIFPHTAPAVQQPFPQPGTSSSPRQSKDCQRSSVERAAQAANLLKNAGCELVAHPANLLRDWMCACGSPTQRTY